MYIYTHSLTYANILTIIDVYRSGQTKLKPVVIDDYNQHMLGVDKLDQFASYYSFLHKSVKWWRKIFIWMLEVAVINSYIIYKKLATSRGQRPMTHKALAKDTSERQEGHHQLRTWKGFRMFVTFKRRGGNARTVGCVVIGHQEVLGTLPSSNVLLAAPSLHYAHHHALNSTTHKETCLAKHHTLHAL